MNASKAKRRWIRWCRYVAKTQTQAKRSHLLPGTHAGQVKAYSDLTYAGRFYPRGVRYVWYPRWGSVR